MIILKIFIDIIIVVIAVIIIIIIIIIIITIIKEQVHFPPLHAAQARRGPKHLREGSFHAHAPREWFKPKIHLPPFLHYIPL